MDEPELRPFVVRRLDRRRLIALDALAAVAYTFMMMGFTAHDVPAMLLTAATGLPLAARRLWPLPVFTLALALTLTSLALGMPNDMFVAAAFALYPVALTQPRRRWIPTSAIGVTSILLLVLTAVVGPSSRNAAIIGTVALGLSLVGGSWTLGRALRERRAHAERTTAQLAERAVTDERLRIAREMHDVVAHNMSLIVVKAGVANHVAESRPEEAREALQIIEATGRAALIEMRQLLGVLRTTPDHTPTATPSSNHFSAPPTSPRIAPAPAPSAPSNTHRTPEASRGGRHPSDVPGIQPRLPAAPHPGDHAAATPGIGPQAPDANGGNPRVADATGVGLQATGTSGADPHVPDTEGAGPHVPDTEGAGPRQPGAKGVGGAHVPDTEGVGSLVSDVDGVGVQVPDTFSGGQHAPDAEGGDPHVSDTEGFEPHAPEASGGGRRGPDTKGSGPHGPDTEGLGPFVPEASGEGHHPLDAEDEDPPVGDGTSGGLNMGDTSGGGSRVPDVSGGGWRTPGSSDVGVRVLDTSGGGSHVPDAFLVTGVGEGAPLMPAPGLAALAGVTDRAAMAGVRVDLDVQAPELPEGVALSVYRIVQEAVTNVVKHAAPARCRVSVVADGQELRLSVTDDGPGTRVLPGGPVPGQGHGLIGMRERVMMYGGELSAGPRPEGGFAVSARWPYDSAER